jgi:hypothetical protein
VFAGTHSHSSSQSQQLTVTAAHSHSSSQSQQLTVTAARSHSSSQSQQLKVTAAHSHGTHPVQRTPNLEMCPVHTGLQAVIHHPELPHPLFGAVEHSRPWLVKAARQARSGLHAFRETVYSEPHQRKGYPGWPAPRVPAAATAAVAAVAAAHRERLLMVL